MAFLSKERKMNGIEIYNKMKRPPKESLKTITAGRLKGMSDINPQWRYQIMAETFGMVGFGWKYEIVKLWNETMPDGQILAFADINVYVKDGDKWSDPIPGSGGSKLVSKETNGLYASDEGYKMAITDALSTALKMLGVAADIYAGLWDGSKYRDTVLEAPQSTQKPVNKKVSTKTPPDIDMDWLKKSLAMLKWNPVPWLNEHFNMEKETVTDCLLKMTKAQRVEFIQVVNDRLEKESPF
jgi:hypothetical protein